MKRHLRTGRVVCTVFPRLEEILSTPPEPAFVGVDIPLGLLDDAVSGGRECDRQARALLGWPRSASVFSPPVRRALAARTYTAALHANRRSSPARVGLSRQVFGLFDKLREADALITPHLQDRVFEVHPEVSFREMNGGETIRLPKKSVGGRALRARLLRRYGFGAIVSGATASGKGVAPDDVLDACAVCWTANRMARGTARRVPSVPPCDERGLRMEIWR